MDLAGAAGLAGGAVDGVLDAGVLGAVVELGCHAGRTGVWRAGCLRIARGSRSGSWSGTRPPPAIGSWLGDSFQPARAGSGRPVWPGPAIRVMSGVADLRATGHLDERTEHPA